MQIDYYAYQSRMRSWNAAFKVFLAVTTLFLVIAFNCIVVSLFVMFAMGVLTLMVGKTSWRVYLRYMLAPVIELFGDCYFFCRKPGWGVEFFCPFFLFVYGTGEFVGGCSGVF